MGQFRMTNDETAGRNGGIVRPKSSLVTAAKVLSPSVRVNQEAANDLSAYVAAAVPLMVKWVEGQAIVPATVKVPERVREQRDIDNERIRLGEDVAAQLIK